MANETYFVETEGIFFKTKFYCFDINIKMYKCAGFGREA